MLDCNEFVNADEIARGLSPFQPEKAMFEAGRIMLLRIHDLLKDGINFAFETTLATKIYKGKIEEARKKGYKITLLFFWLQNVELAKERVKIRVSEGGHNIPNDIIIRRYYRGIINLFDIYLNLADETMIFDNSAGKPILVAEKNIYTEVNVIDPQRYTYIKAQYNASKS